MEANRIPHSPKEDIAGLVSSPSNKSRPTSQSGDYYGILGLDPWFTEPKFTELVAKSSKQGVSLAIDEMSEMDDNFVTATSGNRSQRRNPRHVAPKVKIILPKMIKVPSATHTVHIVAPTCETISLADSKSVSSKVSMINSTSRQSLPSSPGSVEENKMDEFSIASKISNSMSSSFGTGSIPYNGQQSSLYSKFLQMALLPALSKKSSTKLRGSMLQSNSSYIKKYEVNASISQSLMNDSEIMTSNESDLQTTSILSCSNKPTNDQEVNSNPIVHMVHNRVAGWMLTSTLRRQQLVGMLDNAHHTGVPTEIYVNSSTDLSTVSRVRERQVNSWHSKVSRTLQARESVPDCKSTVRGIQEKLLSSKNIVREKGVLTALLNRKLDRIDIIANAKQIQTDDFPQSERK